MAKREAALTSSAVANDNPKVYHRVLKRLQEEVESYQTARSALDHVSVKLAETSGTMQNTAAGLANVIQTLRTIGTPELLQAQQEVTARVAELEQSLRQAISTMNRLPESIGDVADAIREETAALQKSLATRLEDSEKRIGDFQAALQEILSSGFADADKRLETLQAASERDLKAVRRNVLTFGVILVAVQVATAVGLFLGP